MDGPHRNCFTFGIVLFCDSPAYAQSPSPPWAKPHLPITVVSCDCDWVPGQTLARAENAATEILHKEDSL